MVVTPSEARRFLGRYGLTQSWRAHEINTGRPGSVLGGEDFATPMWTPLPVVAGIPVLVTPRTKGAPSWYNSGLGNAGSYRRPDGTWTVYGHCSGQRADGVFLSGNSGTVRPAPTPARPYAGAHVHVHDVASDGRTRLLAFSTISQGGGSGGGDEDEMTPDQEAKLNAIYDAIFTEHETSRGTSGGVLSMLRKIYDGIFIEEETSRGTPGGVLVTLRELLKK